MEIEIDLDDIKEFVTSKKFTDFLLSNTTQFGTAAFILQTVLEKIDELKEEEN